MTSSAGLPPSGPYDLRRRIGRAVRRLLVVLAVLGLLPIHDLVSTLDPTGVTLGCDVRDCEADCTKQGCTPLAHHCGCCTTSNLVAPVAGVPDLSRGFVEQPGRVRRLSVREGPSRSTPPPTPPPIA